VASFDRSIRPGGEGKITLKLDTSKREGSFQAKASVTTNDPKTPQDTLIIRAMIKAPIMVSEKMVLLKGAHQEIVTKSVDIKGELDKPLKLEPVEYTLDKKVTFNLEEITKGRHYRVTFTSIPNTGSSYRGLLKLKTSYPEKPEVMIYVMGKFLY
jgi:hypothetical protein